MLAIDIESGPNCQYDYLKIIDGHTEQGNLLGRFCGKVMPRRLKTKTNGLLVRFVSDDKNVKPGFRINWRAVTRISKIKTTPSMQTTSFKAGK